MYFCYSLNENYGKLDNFFGIVIYSIEDDGCLNGLWTNIKNKGVIRNEIAKKKGCIEKKVESEDDLIGDYLVTFIEKGDIVECGKLKIERSTNGNYFKLDWDIRKGANHAGKGFKIGKQLIVSYWMK